MNTLRTGCRSSRVLEKAASAAKASCMRHFGHQAAKRPTWAQSEQDKLIRIINAKYRGRVAGNWDLVVQHIKDIPTNYRHAWTDEERAELVTHIRISYYLAGRKLNWTKIGRAFGRTGESCRLAYYMRKNVAGKGQVQEGASEAAQRGTDKMAAVEQALRSPGNSEMADRLRQAIRQHTTTADTAVGK
ncbi:hypothetical protein GQ54DRAFT_314390, partial [Martensiomyces pterosporus]